MGNTLTETDVAEFRRVAETGSGRDQEIAKAALAALPQKAEPASGNPATEEKKEVGTAEEVKATEEKSEEKPERKSEVDQAQEKPEEQRRERVHPAVRRLDREKREMARRLQLLEEQNAALAKRFEEAKPRDPAKSEADELNELLANPGKYLAERDRRIVETVRKQMVEDQRRIAQETTRTQVERENALKIINSIEGYNDKRDSDELLRVTAEYLNDVYDTDVYDEDEVAQMWRENPASLAPAMRKAWKKAKELDDRTKSDKKAATSSPTGAGKTPGGRTPTLTDLNAELAKAMTSGDKEAIASIGKKIESLYRETFGDK